MTRNLTDKSWLAVHLSARPPTLDPAVNFLFELGSCGCEYREDSVIAYFRDPLKEEQILDGLQNYLRELNSLGFNTSGFRVESRIIPHADWNSEWKKRFKPIIVSDRLAIRPTWERLKPGPDQVVIEIDPKQAFGTGEHATTQMALRLLENHLSAGDRVLDVGTGTGILAIAAIKLGAENVVAVDIDPVAIDAARENLQRNSTLVKACLVVADLADLKSPLSRFQLILANLNRGEIVRLLPHLKRRLHDDGRLIITGILHDERVTIVDHLQTDGDLLVVESVASSEWLALVLRKA